MGRYYIEDFERMVTTERYIALNQKLPDNIRLFLTTERNKEGINIKNTDVRTMFVESHVECSVVQMAGRLREGVDTLINCPCSSSLPKWSISDWGATGFRLFEKL